ncbi:MAG: amidohydrolase [Acidobacteria bacterium]|nr:MAG: amidohydrolase [Acidobacteriota bacterium]
MNSRTVVTLVALIATAGCDQQTAPIEKGADFVLTNGKVFTVDEARPWAEAVVVKGNDIVYVGDNAGSHTFVGESTAEVDLEGRLLLPGFVESHIHLALGGATTSGVVLSTTDSLEEVLRKVKEYADSHPEKETIFGASYLAGLFDARGPDKALLDEIIPDRPVYLMDHTLHAVWVNSKALEAAGITMDTPNPPGGEFVRDENGEATGAIKGGPAHAGVAVAIGAITAESMAASLPAVIEGLSEFGFTSAIDMGAPIATDQAYEAMYNMSRAGDLPLRLSVTFYVNTPDLAQTAVETFDEYAKKYRTDTLWFDTLKVSGDSVIENQKAAMLEPYLSTGDKGALYFDREALGRMAIGAAELGYHFTVHTIGDAAARTALETAGDLREAGYNTLYSTTHSQLVHPDDRRMYVDYDVTAQTTGNWAVHQPAYEEHLSQEVLLERQFPFRWWFDNGVNVAMGADWPATPGGFDGGVNPFNNIYTAMHRAAPPGKEVLLGSAPGLVLEPRDQVMTLAEAVEAYTMGGARMLGIEDQVGSIEVGKKADLILLDQNLFEIDPAEIPKTKVLATMFDGKVVHDLVYELGDSELVELGDYDLEIEGLCGPTTNERDSN